LSTFQHVVRVVVQRMKSTRKRSSAVWAMPAGVYKLRTNAGSEL